MATPFFIVRILREFDTRLRSCLDFTANKFKKILFCLFEVLFGIFVLSVLANRPLFIFNEDRLYSLSIVSELTCARWHYPCCEPRVQIYSKSLFN